MNSAIFNKWVFEKNFPSLPPHSVIVLDKTRYHCIQLDKPPTLYALRSYMISWLCNKGVDFNASMCKVSLYKLIVPKAQREGF
jgi:hypothetical protein